jgi:hypothetical protein
MGPAADAQVEQAEADIRSFVAGADTPANPADLIQQLTHRGLPESVVRIAIWLLIDRHEIELTADLRLAPARNGHRPKVALAAPA